jgi:hypothetical protein
LLATVMHTLFDVGALRVQANVPRDLLRVLEGPAPIPGLLS